MKDIKKNYGKDELFDKKVVFEAEDSNLLDALMELSVGYVPNEGVRHREIIRAITINTIMSQRHIDRIEKRNTYLTYLIIILTTVSTIIGVIGIIKN